MRKFILIMLIAFIHSNTIAQGEEQYGFSKGDITISGVVSYDNTDSNQITIPFEEDLQESNYKYTNLQIIPEIGYLLSDHMMVGVKAGITNQTSSNDDNYSSKTRGYKTSAFGRYYISPKKRISLFIEMDAGYGRYKSDTETSSSNFISANERITKEYTIQASPGINLFINKNLSLTSRVGSIGYSMSKDTFANIDGDVGSNERNRFNASLNMNNFFFGVLYRI